MTVTTTTQIFVQIDKKNRIKLEFEREEVTGREIKEAANIPLENDLARSKGQELELVTNDQVIAIKNGDQFISLPPGTIS